ncbi:MAG: hypothetical protein IID60_01570 [Proteobacteria bacterium]|nr:hypothetical protein [Pseudomonadota bacterium]
MQEPDYALRSAKNARVTLMAGFTTIREVGASGLVDVVTMKAVERGDSLDVIARMQDVRFVMKSGVVYKLPA